VLGKTIRDNLEISAKESLGYYEWNKHNPWFYKGYSRLLDHKK
jgi:hypothetical protein